MIVYTPLWQTMKEKGVSTYALINKHGVSSSTINRLRHNQGVTLQTVDDLCRILECKLEDIALHIPNEQLPENKE
jgi:DNA-binding Xre family transcriptional regulator